MPYIEAKLTIHLDNSKKNEIEAKLSQIVSSKMSKPINYVNDKSLIKLMTKKCHFIQEIEDDEEECELFVYGYCTLSLLSELRECGKYWGIRGTDLVSAKDINNVMDILWRLLPIGRSIEEYEKDWDNYLGSIKRGYQESEIISCKILKHGLADYNRKRWLQQEMRDVYLQQFNEENILGCLDYIVNNKRTIDERVIIFEKICIWESMWVYIIERYVKMRKALLTDAKREKFTVNYDMYNLHSHQ